MSDRKTGRNADGTFGPGNSGKPKRHMPLTPKQEHFVEEYLIDLNARRLEMDRLVLESRDLYLQTLFDDTESKVRHGRHAHMVVAVL